MKDIIAVIGTRPEAVKMCPLILELMRRSDMRVTVVSAGQHRDMLVPILDFFGVKPDYELDIMREGQSLFDITQKVTEGVRSVLEKEKCDILLVHGDTSTAFAAALAAFYMRVPVGHVEAGLRTYDVYSPYPEEFNRTAIDAMAEYLFAPTKLAASHLIAEGRRSDRVFVTGNTAIDALKYTFRNDFSHEILDFAAGRRLILITAHRRENMENLRGMFRGILRALDEAEDVCAVYPMHPNPEIRRIAHEILGNNERIRLCAPLDMLDFHNILARTYIAVTDSGGIQEETPYFGVPTLVMRGTTERPEAQEAGAAMLIGNSEASVCEGMRNVISNAEIYRAMSRAGNPYGDGCASGRIADIIERAKL